MSRSFRTRLFLCGALALVVAALPAVAASDSGGTKLLSGTAILLSQTSSGNGGNTSSTTSSTNIFSPAAYADYKRFGGEPTTTVDRFKLTSGTVRG